MGLRAGGPTARHLLAWVLVTSVAAACAEGDSETTPTTAATSSAQATTTPSPPLRSGGEVVYAADAEPSTFNVRTRRGGANPVPDIMEMVWPSVWTVTPSYDLELNTDLVQSAEVTSRDPHTIVYRIHPDAAWSDGTPITAADFEHTWMAQQPEATDVDGSPMDAVDLEGGITSVEGSDEGKTVTVVLEEPNAEWRGLFSAPLVPAHVAQAVGWNTGFDQFDPEVVISGGPFRISGHNPGRDLTLERNDAYWGEPARLDAIRFRFIGESAETVPALENGEVDLIAPRAQIDLVTRARSIPGVSTEVFFGLQYEVLELNVGNALLAVPEVRRALALALDRQAIVEATAGQVDSRAQVLNNRLYVPSQPEYSDNSGGGYDRPDLDTARALLEGVGFAEGGDGVYARDGQRLAFRITTTAGDALRQSQQELIQAQALAAGIELTIDNVASNELGQALSTGDFDISNIFRTNPLLTSQTRVVFASDGAFNFSAHASSRIDELYLEARTEFDHAARAALYNEIDALLWEDLPTIPLYQRPGVVAHREDLLNIEPNPAEGLFWNAAEWAFQG